MDQVQDIVTGNPTVIKMVVSFNRGARGQNTLRQLLAPVVKEIIDDKSLVINTSPVEVYKAWVNQLETQTGEARYQSQCAVLRSFAHVHFCRHYTLSQKINQKSPFQLKIRCSFNKFHRSLFLDPLPPFVILTLNNVFK